MNDSSVPRYTTIWQERILPNLRTQMTAATFAANFQNSTAAGDNGSLTIYLASQAACERVEKQAIGKSVAGLIARHYGDVSVSYAVAAPTRPEVESVEDSPKKLKRVVIKEELVALTGHYLPALILNQFLYWSVRVKDYDRFIEEERKRNPESNGEPTRGWIYKSAEELSGELMIGASHPTVRKYIKQLVKAGYLAERRNPKFKWDRTWQYRVDIRKIQADLEKLKYVLDGYPL